MDAKPKSTSLSFSISIIFNEWLVFWLPVIPDGYGEFCPSPRAPVPTCLCSGKITVTIETTGSGYGEIELCLLFYSEIISVH